MMQVVIIGGGPAGIEAARTAAPHATVKVVTAGAVGEWRPMTMRVWLAAAAAGERDVAKIVARAKQVATEWQTRCADELATLEVEIIAGRGRLGKPGEVLVEAPDGGPAQSLNADAIILASGAQVAFPEAVAPDGERMLTSGDLGVLQTCPERVMVLGDGRAGFELCHLFSLLGADVSWLIPEASPRTQVAPEVDGYLTRMLERQGVRVVPHATVQRLAHKGEDVTATLADGTRYGGEIALLAFERRPDPMAVGLSLDLLDTDIYGQTKLRGVYLVGDILAPQAASIAMAQGRAAALHAVRRSSAPADIRDIVLTFMYQPQVAKVGRLTTEGAHGSVTIALNESMAAHADGATEGFLTLAWDHGGYVAGALAVAPAAAEILAPIAMAMRAGMQLRDLAAIYGPHPSVSELAAMAARRIEL
ncbi:FAD-dependent oxidoreductase [Candidatus Chloroploca sp. Khr17]|uniref:FAD-dependent oxidoreductase n=1 Tax=Candidatus Chloroploca sp. Khr17 TaxID=2496869 RepID=UPI00101D051B|nr:FAD-dependent oxidoreductase [Candidatus Chloroploca sp. Khr17]